MRTSPTYESSSTPEVDISDQDVKVFSRDLRGAAIGTKADAHTCVEAQQAMQGELSNVDWFLLSADLDCDLCRTPRGSRIMVLPNVSSSELATNNHN